MGLRTFYFKYFWEPKPNLFSYFLFFRQSLQTDCSLFSHVPFGLFWPLHGHLPGSHSNCRHAHSGPVLQPCHGLADGPGLQCCRLLHGVYARMKSLRHIWQLHINNKHSEMFLLNRNMCVFVSFAGVCQWAVSVHVNSDRPGALAHHLTCFTARPQNSPETRVCCHDSRVDLLLSCCFAAHGRCQQLRKGGSFILH